MKFETIHLDGFGCLCGVTFKLLPGLNIFYGPNESGKSTLQQAIWALLYSFYKEDRRTHDETELLERYRPWSGGTYAGYLVYYLDNGTTFRVERSFGDSDLRTSIREADTGRDITANFERGRLGRVAFAREHFGLSQDVFINTCFVRQADLHRLAHAAQEITETVVNLAGTGSQDRSVKRAQELLKKALDEHVGSARARSKPFAIAQGKLEQLKQEAQQMQARRRELESDYEQRAQLLGNKAQLAQEVTRLEFLLAVSQRDRLAGRVDSIKAMHSKKDEAARQLTELREVTDFPVELHDKVARLYQEWVSCTERLARAHDQVEVSRIEAAQLKRKCQDLLEEQRTLESARNIPLDQEADMRRLELRWREAANSVQRVEKSLRDAQVSVDEMEPARELAAQRLTLFEMGPYKLHDVKMRWEAAEKEVTAAAHEVEVAEQAWQTTSLALESYEQLRVHFSEFSPETLSALKEQDATVRQLREQVSSGLNPRTVRVLLVTGGLIGMGSLVTFTLGIARNLTALVPAGISLLAVSIGLVILTLFNRRQGNSLRQSFAEASRRFGEKLGEYGFETVTQLDKSYLAYLTAQTPYDQLVRARAALIDKQAALDKIRTEVRVLLGLAPEAEVTSTVLESMEREVQEITEQIKELTGRERQRNELRGTAQQLTEDLIKVEDQLRASLLGVGLCGSDLTQDVKHFYDLCEQRRHIEKLDAELQALDTRLGAHVAREADARNIAIELDSAQTQVQRVLRQARISETDPEQGFRIFQARCEQAEAARRIRSEVESFNRETQALQGDQSLDQLSQQCKMWSDKAHALLAARPDYSGMTTSEQPGDTQRQLDDVRQKLASVNSNLAVIEERISRAWTGLRSLAEVEEEILTTQETITILELHGQALDLAREQLAAAADEHHRNFLPRLNQIVGHNLSRVTGGRYGGIQIDHADLQVRLQVPELSRPVTADVLSRGTQEQIYLLLRLGLTELMSGSRERLPLILDDPLVNYDHDRLLRGLDFLAEMSKQTQVLLFTKDEETVHWFHSQHENSDMHKLHKW